MVRWFNRSFRGLLCRTLGFGGSGLVYGLRFVVQGYV